MKGAIETASHNRCSSVAAPFFSLTIRRYTEHLEYSLHLFLNTRVALSLSRFRHLLSAFAFHGWKWKSQAKRGQEKSQQSFHMLILWIRALPHTCTQHVAYDSYLMLQLNHQQQLLGHLCDACELFLVLPWLSTRMSAPKGKMGRRKAVGGSNGNVSSLWSRNIFNAKEPCCRSGCPQRRPISSGRIALGWYKTSGREWEDQDLTGSKYLCGSKYLRGQSIKLVTQAIIILMFLLFLAPCGGFEGWGFFSFLNSLFLPLGTREFLKLVLIPIKEYCNSWSDGVVTHHCLRSTKLMRTIKWKLKKLKESQRLHAVLLSLVYETCHFLIFHSGW